MELLDESQAHDVTTTARIQADTVSLPARRILPLLGGLDPVTPQQHAGLGDEVDAEAAAGSA